MCNHIPSTTSLLSRETAYATSLYVNPPPTHEFEPHFLNLPSPRTVIELGSGSGVIAAAIGNVLDPHEDLMIATDLPEVRQHA